MLHGTADTDTEVRIGPVAGELGRSLAAIIKLELLISEAYRGRHRTITCEYTSSEAPSERLDLACFCCNLKDCSDTDTSSV